jgi:glycosyltransferase involved in cell wall biosynthesis
MSKKVSVVIPTYNRKDILKTTLSSLVGQTFTDFEVLVADDGGSDGTGEMLKSLNLPFPIQHLWHKNAGRSAARNMGIKAAEGEIILFVDDHIILTKNFIEEHLKTHEKYKSRGVGAVRGYVEFIKDPSLAPPRPRHLSLFTKIRLFFEYQDPLRFYTHNVSVRKEALLKIGGFDEDFKEYGFQDQECGYRITRAGYKIRFNPNAIGYIFKAVFNFEKECDKQRQAGRSAALCRKKHPKFGLRCGANPINLFLYRILSANNNWWLRRAQEKLGKAKGKEVIKYQDRIKLFYFVLGVQEGSSITVSSQPTLKK